MIKLTTPCKDCAHLNVCSYKDRALTASNKLKSQLFGNNHYDDYDWEIMSTAQHFDITFSCRDFHKKEEQSDD